jgi:hypothetical protein
MLKIGVLWKHPLLFPNNSPSKQDLNGEVSFFVTWVGKLYVASLRHHSDVVRGGGVGAENVKTFESSDRDGSIIPCALCIKARNSAWALFRRL